MNMFETLDYLIVRRWIDSSWIVDGDLTVRSLASRHRNLGVEGPNGNGYLIKQADELSTDSRRTLAREASFYELHQGDPSLARLSRFLPVMVHRDFDQKLLILNLIPGAANPSSTSTEPSRVEGSRLLGRALAELHHLFRFRNFIQDPRLNWMGRGVPFAFSIHRPWPSLLSTMSPAELRVYQIVQQQEGLDGILEDLRSRWQSETVIHGDVKSSNVLVRATETSAENPAGVELWLIDWEMVQIGDPAWDLAGALQDFLVQWVWSMPFEPDLEVSERAARAKYPLESFRPSVRALWEGYRSSAELDPQVAEDLLTRAVAFSAVRLLQTAIELSAEQSDLSSRAVLLLQISANLLANPLFGQIHLYEIVTDPIHS